MASLLFTILSGISRATINEAAFSSTNFADHGEEKRKRHNLAIEKLQGARDEWNEDRMKWLDFINKRLREKNEARAYTNNIGETMLEYEYLENK